MPKRITYLEKRDGLTREAFRAHWSTTHADIAQGLPGVTDYRQNHLLESTPGLGAGLYSVDGIVELWFADDDVVQAGFDSAVADRLIVDEQEFLSGLTGGPVHAGGAHAPWPFKLWVLARWRDDTAADVEAVEPWAGRLGAAFDGALGWGVNVLVPGAELLVRAALRREEQIPQVAVSIGFADEASARTAVGALTDQAGDHLDGVRGILAGLYACVAEELVII
ncbi:uncharacterized protein (TIGR02118 family) [Pseudarthrobacter oxydans]|uniref:EthD domain-containing protein n=1 Tax=Pseudarthrobacter oxydans TaxID=1671 RepID=UPI002786F4B2|nr:EthD domain-containing protein [Pseudarthrobacter oxydans]MDP9982352.1 uncharacterized protein (TIGR02118 family) [Pseudarthrobacter oxydans]